MGKSQRRERVGRRVRRSIKACPVPRGKVEGAGREYSRDAAIVRGWRLGEGQESQESPRAAVNTIVGRVKLTGSWRCGAPVPSIAKAANSGSNEPAKCRHGVRLAHTTEGDRAGANRGRESNGGQYEVAGGGPVRKEASIHKGMARQTVRA